MIVSYILLIIILGNKQSEGIILTKSKFIKNIRIRMRLIPTNAKDGLGIAVVSYIMLSGFFLFFFALLQLKHIIQKKPVK